ncbi:uncharacterized protein LOC116207780 [Punica granatum]|uniref:Uncharacterized protein LOC116207780 n=1 Tax=Punica granatum TaxID=22663 RepID=A0A6P8DKD0_PUNGR|nr:uncharacterized protein LOC116207780 [Punica granatum]
MVLAKMMRACNIDAGNDDDWTEEGTDTEYFSDYVDSDNEVVTHNNSGDEGRKKRKRGKKRYITFNPNTPINEVEFSKNLIFEGPDQFKKVVQGYAIFQGFNILWKRTGDKKIEATCKNKECAWRIYGSWTFKKEGFAVKKLEGNHVNVQLGITVTKTTCYKARSLACKKILGTLEEHYNLLPSYIAELKKVNRTSTFEVVLDRGSPDGAVRFKRFYVCFDSLRKGFLEGCRSVIGLDGCFLKSKLGGQLLSAVGRDGNNQMFPFAWAVVEGENENSWRWFLDLLMKDLGIKDGYRWTIISDQQKGLEKAVKVLLPHVEHRNCARHIYANWKKNNGGVALKSLFWRAVMCTTEVEFFRIMEEMRAVSVKACDQFMQVGPQKFCRAFISEWNKCEIVHNNICECFNAYILQARAKPLIDMLEDIRTRLMKMMAEKKQLVIGSTDELCPRVKKKVEEARELSWRCTIVYVGESKFQVADLGEGYVVDLKRMTCTCRRWNLNGIPCLHAMGCIVYWNREEPQKYVHEYFKREMYLKAYEQPLEPPNGKNLWAKVQDPPALPPQVRKMPGRPKNSRNKDASEKELTRKRSNKKENNQAKLSTTHKRRGRKKKIAKLNLSQLRSNIEPGDMSQHSMDEVITQDQQRPVVPEVPSARPGCVSDIRPPKLQAKRKQIAPTLKAQISKEIALAKKGCGKVVESLLQIMMPDQPVRISYIGEYGG